MIATLLAVLAFGLVPMLAEYESRISDRVRLALAPGPSVQDARISFVAVDEATMATLPYRSPLDRGLIADVLESLALGGARAVGLDILIDQPTEPDKDTRLSKAIRDFPGAIVLAWADEAAGLTKAQVEWLQGFGEESGATLGDVGLTAEGPGVVRAHHSRAQHDAPPDFAVALARAVDRDAQPVSGLIDWRQSTDETVPVFQTTPAHILPLLTTNPAILKTWFEGRVVILGADLPLQDRHETPLSVLGLQSMTTPGAVIHAHLLSQALDGRKVAQLSGFERAAIVLVLLTIMVLLTRNMRSILLRGGVVIFVLAAYFALLAAAVAQGLPVAPVGPSAVATALAFVGMSAIDTVAARRDRQFIQGAFSQYLAPELVQRLVRNPSTLRVGGERRELSFLFTDIAGFTTLSEKMPPEELSPLLNAYLDGVCDIVIANHGVIDKFIGDAVVALFGVPQADPRHAANAIACARQIDAFSQAFRADPAHADLGVTRIGVHSGEATVGNFGGTARFDYTAIGDAMNTAARLEGANKYFGTRVAISGACFSAAGQHLDADIALQPIGDIVLKGKTEPLTVMTVPQNPEPGWLARYNQAYCHLDTAPDEAAALFKDLGDDPVVALHLDRMSVGARGRVIVMAEK